MTTGLHAKEAGPVWAGSPVSRQVAYHTVYQLLSPLLGDPGLIPGTPVWCQLDSGDPAKWQAVLWAAIWWCVDQEVRQEAMAEASREVSAAADWADIARSHLRHARAVTSGAYISRTA